MSRPIDADELLAHVWRDRLDSRERIADLVKSMPTIRPERKRGKWKSISDGYADIYECNQCGETEDFERNFCPHCGARMMEGEMPEVTFTKQEAINIMDLIDNNIFDIIRADSEIDRFAWLIDMVHIYEKCAKVCGYGEDKDE